MGTERSGPEGIAPARFPFGKSVGKHRETCGQVSGCEGTAEQEGLSRDPPASRRITLKYSLRGRRASPGQGVGHEPPQSFPGARASTLPVRCGSRDGAWPRGSDPPWRCESLPQGGVWQFTLLACSPPPSAHQLHRWLAKLPNTGPGEHSTTVTPADPARGYDECSREAGCSNTPDHRPSHPWIIFKYIPEIILWFALMPWPWAGEVGCKPTSFSKATTWSVPGGVFGLWHPTSHSPSGKGDGRWLSMNALELVFRGLRVFLKWGNLLLGGLRCIWLMVFWRYKHVDDRQMNRYTGSVCV